jgi:predicted nucleic acid-binding protein
MSFLLDTNVFSEMRKGPHCHDAVKSWWSGVDDSSLFLSVIVLGEIRRGICKIEKEETARAAKYEEWLSNAMQLFTGRILIVDLNVAVLWGRLTAGRSLPLADSLLAATAITHGLTLVTRNTRDIEGTGVKYLNPFELADIP